MKVVVAGALCTWHNPRPSAFTVRLSHGLGMQLHVGQQAVDNLSSGSVRRTGGDHCEAAERTIHVQHVKGARSQTCNSQTGIPLQCIVYCNKEHQSCCTRSLYTSTLISRTCDLLSFLIGTLRRHRSLPWALHMPSNHHTAAKPTDV